MADMSAAREPDPKVAAVIADYEARADREHALLDGLLSANSRKDIDELLLPVGPATAALLSILIRESEARAILEVGTSYGYSTVWLADAARATGGLVTTLELHPRKVEYARTQLARAGLAEFVDFRVGDALATLHSLPGPFDFVLIDLWKDLYIACFELIYPKLRAGGFIAADNMLQPENTIAYANAYREYLRTKPDLDSVLLPVGSGVELTRRR
jgi:predicted O-methyltransferase YrrM